MKTIVGIALLAAAVGAAPVFAEDRADLDKTQIIGNRELPKVLYIVPWKKPMPDETSHPAGPTLLPVEILRSRDRAL